MMLRGTEVILTKARIGKPKLALGPMTFSCCVALIGFQLEKLIF